MRMNVKLVVMYYAQLTQEQVPGSQVNTLITVTVKMAFGFLAFIWLNAATHIY